MLLEDFDEAFEWTPTKDSNVFVIDPQAKSRPVSEKMTVEDWNKFEKDIVDAFEQVP